MSFFQDPITSVGTVSDASAVLANRIPYLEITYPIPHVLNRQEDHEIRKTLIDQPQQGLNFYEQIVKIGVGSNNKGERPTDAELQELTQILKGGVILNVYSS